MPPQPGYVTLVGLDGQPVTTQTGEESAASASSAASGPARLDDGHLPTHG
jgi:hypothetical protein